MYTLILTAASTTSIRKRGSDVLAHIADLPQTRLAELLPWRWRAATVTLAT